MSNDPSSAPPSPFQIVTSRNFTEWMGTWRLSLAVSTYHIGAVIFVGLKSNGDLSMFVSSFDRAMGMWPHGSALWLATARTIWKLENALAGSPSDGYDRLFVPRVGYMTGDIDVHDIALTVDGRPVFISSKFSCLATVDERFSFRPLWKPPFVSGLVPEDRCHLNGLAMDAGQPRYVTLVARSDTADGWRDFRDTGGLVMDVCSGETVAEGLSMPHSPRLHQGKLWLLNAGTGFLGFVDPKHGKFEPVTFIPGFARGLSIHENFAFVGISRSRRENAFQGLALDRNLAEKGAAARCGIQVIDLTTGAVVHWARIEPPIEELYDVAVLPGVVRPKALGFTSSVLGDQITFEEAGRIQFWSAAPGPRR